MNMIAAVDLNWGIGYKGELLQRIPEDMRRFREITTGKVVVTGRKTLETFPGKKPLKDRVNIVLTSDRDFPCENAVLCHSFEELKSLLKEYNTEEIFVIGGASVYELLLPYCQYAYITKIHKDHEADRWLKDLEAAPEWEAVWRSEIKNNGEGLEFQFVNYKNRQVEELL